MILKFIVPLLIIVMFKCNSLSSAPTDLQTETSSVSSKNDSDDQSGFVASNDNGLMQLHRSVRSDNNEIEARRRSAVDKGFMRFGRAGNILRFGRSMPSEYGNEENEVDDEEKQQFNEPFSMKMRRGNMMRFGRNYLSENGDENDDYNDASENLDLVDMPVRRAPENKYSEQGSKILRLGRSSESVEGGERNSREKKPTDGNILRFGRASNMLRFGRAGNMMRFGRGDNMMRFGRANNMVRFGRAGNVMRFGKRMNSIDYLRPNRAGNIIRFGRSDKNPMRFGKRSEESHHGIPSDHFCEDYDCLDQERENQQTDIQHEDELSSLFGDGNNDDITTQSQPHKEYIITK